MIANAETTEDKSYRIIDLRGASSDGWNDSPSRGPAGVRVTPETAMQCSTVLACVRLIAENVATIPLHVFRRLPEGGKERARDLPLSEFAHINECASERPRGEPCNSPRSDREGQSDDRHGEDGASEQPAESGKEAAAEDEPGEVEQERHGAVRWSGWRWARCRARRSVRRSAPVCFRNPASWTPWPSCHGVPRTLSSCMADTNTSSDASDPTAIRIGVDVVVFTIRDDALHVLLAPARAEWSLPSDLIRPDETVDASARRALSDAAGPGEVWLEQLYTKKN
jgi:hypothetical protein